MKDTSQDLRKNIELKDNLFLDRYAQSVTLNGEMINADAVSVEGYGVWRLTRADYERILSGKRQKNTKTTINTDFFNNVQNGCGQVDGFDRSKSLDEILGIVNLEPCVSAMALVTLLFIQGLYPVPIEFDAQENILYQISDQVVMSWDDTLNAEQMNIKALCKLADIDFEFVVDASGSVGEENWKLSMDQIANFWIRGAIEPNGATECGNHVGARRFSSNDDASQVRWHDFTPPDPSVYSQYSNYTEYVAAVFENEGFTGGGTATAEALRRVRVEDVPTERNGKKYVMVFTDGKSKDSEKLPSEATQLHAAVDEVFAFGIGDGPNEDELELIASNSTRGFGWEIMEDFSKYEYFIRNFIKVQGGCDTKFIKPFRTDDIL